LGRHRHGLGRLEIVASQQQRDDGAQLHKQRRSDEAARHVDRQVRP
jgi:hypothetical protein